MRIKAPRRTAVPFARQARIPDPNAIAAVQSLGLIADDYVLIAAVVWTNGEQTVYAPAAASIPICFPVQTATGGGPP